MGPPTSHHHEVFIRRYCRCVLDFVTLITATGAAARLTRLATTDPLLDGPRAALLHRIAQPKHLRTQAQQAHDISPHTPLHIIPSTPPPPPWHLAIRIS